MKIAFAKSELPSAGTIVVGVLEEHRLTPTAQQLDKLTKGAIDRALSVGRFKGRPDEQLAILAPPGIEAARILLIGLGKADSPRCRDRAGASAGGSPPPSTGAGEHAAAVAVDDVAGARIGTGELAAISGLGRALAQLSLRQIPHHARSRSRSRR